MPSTIPKGRCFRYLGSRVISLAIVEIPEQQSYPWYYQLGTLLLVTPPATGGYSIFT
jgi:hypothetical protein